MTGKVAGSPQISARGFSDDPSPFNAVLPLIDAELDNLAADGVTDAAAARAGRAAGAGQVGVGHLPPPPDDHPGRPGGVAAAPRAGLGRWPVGGARVRAAAAPAVAARTAHERARPWPAAAVVHSSGAGGCARQGATTGRAMWPCSRLGACTGGLWTAGRGTGPRG